MAVVSIDTKMHECVEETFASFLGMPLVADESVDLSGAEDVISGCIPFKGTWRGCLIVSSSSQFASDAAGKCFGCPDPDADMLADIMGEISNIVAGNFTAVLPDDVELSIPVVVKGKDYQTGIPRGRVLREYGYSSLGQPICVTLMKRADE